jgi:hypothetical protein
MSNEERVEEICYQHHKQGTLHKLLNYVIDSERGSPSKSQIEHFELAHFKVTTENWAK